MTTMQLRQLLGDAGYDLDRIDGVSRDLGFDLLDLLAAWTPAILGATRKPSLWQRFLKWRKP